MERWRRIHGIPIVQHPKYYPADPSLAHRVLLAAIEGSGNDSPAVQEFARLGLEAVLARELDIANEATIETALTKEAESKQYFGAPLYSFRGEPFWGQDRLDMLDDAIKSGRDPIVRTFTPFTISTSVTSLSPSFVVDALRFLMTRCLTHSPALRGWPHSQGFYARQTVFLQDGRFVDWDEIAVIFNPNHVQNPKPVNMRLVLWRGYNAMDA
ncbi:uncharacterized protein BDW70DRAFT_159991 [Aspergillus foveolatus]|uniref:uncharacterized protein n=1 Tax=Aspergillus foveolatus TaxID=210207 RepID=UPI003CCDBC13